MATPVKKSKRDLLKELSYVPKRLYNRMFRRGDFFYSEHMDRWTFTIEYGFGHRVFGTGKSPHRALSECLNQLNQVLGKTGEEDDVT